MEVLLALTHFLILDKESFLKKHCFKEHFSTFAVKISHLPLKGDAWFGMHILYDCDFVIFDRSAEARLVTTALEYLILRC